MGEREVGQTDTSFALVGTEYLIICILQLVEMVVGEEDDREGFCGLTSCFGALGVPEKGDDSDIPRACNVRCKTVDRLT